MKLLVGTLLLLVLQAGLVIQLSSSLVGSSPLQLWLVLPTVVTAALCLLLHFKYQLRKLFPLASVLIHAIALLPYLGLVNNEAEGERAILIMVMIPLYQSIAILILGLGDYVRRREANKRLASQA